VATFIGIRKLRVQVRRTTRYVAETFRRRKDGKEWALEMERNIDRNGSSKPRVLRNVRTFGDLIDLHVEDMHEVGRPPRRSKAAVMEALKDRARQCEASRAQSRAAHRVWKKARLAGRWPRDVGDRKSKERDRRPKQDELDELIEYFETNRRQFIPMGRIVRYAVATTLRQEEICKPEWPLLVPACRSRKSLHPKRATLSADARPSLLQRADQPRSSCRAGASNPRS
jgi:hypothetical protein